jgi:hypothetical protein
VHRISPGASTTVNAAETLIVRAASVYVGLRERFTPWSDAIGAHGLVSLRKIATVDSQEVRLK